MMFSQAFGAGLRDGAEETRGRGHEQGGARDGDLQREVEIHLVAAINGLRKSDSVERLAWGLPVRAWYLAWCGDASGARADLDEALTMTLHGPMMLARADVLLTRARLFFRENGKRAAEDLASARSIILEHGYRRRDAELGDAERVMARPFP